MKLQRMASIRLAVWLLGLLLAADGAALAQTGSSVVAPKSKSSASTAQSTPKKKKSTRKRPSWFVPTYADSTKDDIAEFDDPVVREVAVEALGRYNGAVVVVDPNTGRVLSIVNQRLAFSAGFQPCSTIKPVVAVAALTEGIITRDTMIRVGRRRYMNLTEAMAHSNNPYFEVLGRQMGFETVSKYARQLGLGEAAGYHIFEEHPGILPSVAPANGGVGRMSSYGEGIQMTPLQLAGMVSAFANGGTLYHLQYPRTEDERRSFAPRVKRKLGIEALLPELREGMLAAVLYGTARSSWDPEGEETLGKTGTCSDQGSRLGWYVSYAGQSQPRVSVVVLLRGQSRRVNGPTAADIAGRIYHGLRERNFFTEHSAKGGNGPTP
jgi:cell division protein FtsI/penicillin-binding protein 2